VRPAVYSGSVIPQPDLVQSSNPPGFSGRVCAAFWIPFGDSLRQEIKDPRFCDWIRPLLPPYQGPPLRLFRAEHAFNLDRRTYGLSWTSDRAVAEDFAKKQIEYCGQSVLLAADVPAEAIVCMVGDRTGESEYVVDGRLLAGFEVIDRYGQPRKKKPTPVREVTVLRADGSSSTFIMDGSLPARLAKKTMPEGQATGSLSD
jgi:hypothetical protein